MYIINLNLPHELTFISFIIMGLLSMNSEQLRYKMKHLDELCPNRSVTNDDEFYELYSKLKDVIEDTNYNIDIVDCLTALHCAMEDFEMNA